ncbi:unnamed protein product [Closterium sp. NIES-54]
MEPPPAVDESDDDTCVSPSPTPPPHSPCCSSPGVMVAWAGYERFKVGIMEPPPAADESDDDAYTTMAPGRPSTLPITQLQAKAPLSSLPPSPSFSCHVIVTHRWSSDLVGPWQTLHPPPHTQSVIFFPLVPHSHPTHTPSGGAQTTMAPGRPSILPITLLQAKAPLPIPLLLLPFHPASHLLESSHHLPSTSLLLSLPPRFSCECHFRHLMCFRVALPSPPRVFPPPPQCLPPLPPHSKVFAVLNRSRFAPPAPPRVLPPPPPPQQLFPLPPLAPAFTALHSSLPCVSNTSPVPLFLLRFSCCGKIRRSP